MDTIKINDKEFTPEEIQRMIDANIGIGEKHDVFQAAPSAQMPHGLMHSMNVAGLLTRPGAEPGMFSTITQPDGAWLSQLMSQPSLILNPEYDILTGVRDCVGNNAANGCSQAPTAGLLKLCTTSNRFGEINMQLDQVQINKLGGRLNRADLDKSIINNPMMYPFMPEIVRQAQNINTPLGMALIAFGVTVHRWITRTVFHGVWGTAPANTYCGFTEEFDGFDRLIRTGYLDITQQNAHCTAADSKVVSWANNGVCDTYNGYTLYDLFRWLMQYLEQKADAQGMFPTQWVIAMHPNLFNALAECVPCDYYTTGCNLRDDNSERVVDGMASVDMRQRILGGSFLPINGRNFPVWQTSAIEQTAYGSGFRSGIYVIPLNSLGFKTTALEWFDQNNADVREYIAGNPMARYGTMNNGLWAISDMQTRMCLEKHLAAQPRLVMRTPWLAARITNIVYDAPFDLFQDSPYPDETYHKDGGRYITPGPYYGGDWVGDQVLR